VSAELTKQRRNLLREIERLAKLAVFGTPSETYRTCGQPGCRCHGEGPKHGPHLYVSFRGDKGKTTGYYVPKAAHQDIRQGVDAWKQLQQELRKLAELNKDAILGQARRKGSKA
jgi:hypothetical protein